MRSHRAARFGTFLLLCGLVAVVAHSRRVGAIPVPPVCTWACTESQYVLLCFDGTTTRYTTKRDCDLCKGDGDSDCEEVPTGTYCDKASEQVWFKFVFSSEACSCSALPPFVRVEAVPDDSGSLSPDPITRRRCWD